MRVLSMAGAMLAALFVVLLGSVFPQRADASWAGNYALANTGGLSPRSRNCDTFEASNLSSGTSITINLMGRPTGHGTMSDPYLHVFDANGNQVATNDDGGTGYNSRLTLTWYSGYRIGASTFGSESTGVTYWLSVTAGTWSRTSKRCGPTPKSNQTITFNTPSAQTFQPSGIFTVSATASSGLPVSFSSSTTSVCTTGGPNGSTITMQGAGTCTLTASQAGDSSWNAASNVTRSFAINKANQSITFGSLSNRTYSATAFSVSGSASSGLAVSFSSLTTSVCTVSGTNVTMLASGSCTVRASQAGNTNYNAATSVDQSFTVTKANQTISFANPGDGVVRRYNSTFTVSATSTSGLTVAFSSRTTSTCTVSGTTVSLISTGTCTLRATQVGDTRFNAATDVDQTFTVDKALQTITYVAPAGRTYGDASFTTSGTASSGQPVTFESITPTTCSVATNTVSILGAGDCTIRASQSGNALFEAAPLVDRTFAIARKTLTAPSASVAARVYNGTRTAGAVTVGQLTGLVGNETLNVSGSGADYSVPDITAGGLNFFAVRRTSSTYTDGKGVIVTASTPNLCTSGTKSQINDNWGTGSPGGSCPVDYFSTYYEGSLVSPVTGTVTFYTSTDDGFYMTIDGADVIDSWRNQGPATYNAQGSIAMVAGQSYEVKVWHYEAGGGAAARLFWSYPGQSTQVVPASVFFRGRPTTVTFSLADGSNGGRAANYQIATATLSGAVTPRPLTITANNITRSTSDDAPTFGLSSAVIDGLAPGEELSSLTYNFRLATSTGAYSTTVPSANVVATHTVLPSGAVLANSRPLSNYVVTYEPGTYTINVGAASKLSVPAFNTSMSRVSGLAFGTQPVVTIQDDTGINTVTTGDASTAVVTATLTSGSNGELVGATTATAVQGVARFANLGIRGLVGTSYEITYTATYATADGPVTVAGVATQTASVTHGVAAGLNIVREVGGARSAVAFTTQPQVEVVDVKGNRVTTGTSASASVTVSLAGTGVTLSGTVTRAASLGLVTYSGLALSGVAQDAGGNNPYNLVFASAGLATVTQSDIALGAGNPARLTLLRRSEGTASGVAFTTAPQIGVLDGQGNQVTDATGTVTATLTRVNSTGVLVNGASATTATATLSSGVATFTDLGITGLQNTSYAITYSATINNVAMTTARQDVIVTVGPPASLRVDVLAAGATSRVALTTQPRLSVLDSGGNVVTANDDQGTVTVVARKSNDAAVVAEISSETASTANGIAQFSGLTLQGEATTYTLTYSFANGSRSFSTTGTLALTAGPATKLVLERASSTTVAAGVSLATQPIVRVTDADNNLVSTSSAPITVSLTGPGVLGGTSTVNAVGGRATFSGLNIRGTAGASAYTLSFSTTQSGLSSVAQDAAITVTHGAVNKVVVVNAAEVEAGTAKSGQGFSVDPVVQIQDAWGNKISTGVWSTATISTSSTTGSTRVGTLSAPAVAGEYTFSTLGLRGVAGTTYAVTYTATYSGSTLGNTGRHNVTVSPGTATKVRLLRQSAGNSSGAAFSTQPQIELLDADNNRVPTSDVVITATLESTVNGTLIAGTNTATTTDGIATFAGLGITGKAGSTFKIIYRDSAASLTSVSQSLTLVAGAPTALQMVTSSNLTLASGSTFTTAPVVRVVDAYGNAVSTNTVVIAAELESDNDTVNGTVIGTTTRTTSSGSATFTGLGIRGVIGSYKLKFTASNLTEVEQASNVTLSHGPAAMLVVANEGDLEGPSNVAASGAAFTEQPVVEVRDISGNTVTTGTGATATVSVSASTGSSLIQNVTAIAEDGVATFAGVGVNGRANTQYTLTYRATVGSTVLTSATHNITASVGAAKKLSLIQPAVGTASSEVFTTQPKVRLLDSGNNVVLSDNKTVTASIAQVNDKGELFSSTSLSASTDASGIATFAGLGIRGVAGQAYTVTYAATDLTAVTQSIRVSPGVAATTTVSPAASFFARGGSINDITVNGETWRVHTFANVGESSFVVPSGVPVGAIEYLVVGGGGGGGAHVGGGGGGGGVRTGTANVVGGATIPVSVGTGGQGGMHKGLNTDGCGATNIPCSNQAQNGQDSSLGLSTGAVQAVGGGSGGHWIDFAPRTGGSGGGSGASTVSGGVGTVNQGNSGGVGFQPADNFFGGGGGGAGGAGTNASAALAGNGGAGVSSSITGASLFYGGGGGGGVHTFSATVDPGTGGSGVGGNGAEATQVLSNGVRASDGMANRGGGGGGSGNPNSYSSQGGDGGSGVVIIRYRLETHTAASGIALDPQPTVRVTDADGNLVDTSSALVSVSVSRLSSDGNAGELIGGTQVRAVNGVATFADLAILGTADREYELSFSIDGESSSSTMLVRLEAGDPVALDIGNSPSTQISGSAESVALATAPQIRLLDSMGNVTVRDNVNVNVSVSAGGSLSGTTTAQTNASGIATLNAFTIGARVGTYTLTFSSDGLEPVSHTVTAVAGTASKIVVDPSVETIRAGSGTRFNIDGAVRITDAAGNTVTSSTATITATSRLASNDTIAGTLTNNGAGSGSTVTVSAVNGVVPLSSFALAGTADAAYTITYTGTGLTSDSHSVTLTAGVPAQVAVASSVIAGSNTVSSGTTLPIQPKLAIRDSSGNAVMSADTSTGLKLYAKSYTAATVENPANRTDLSADNTRCFSGSVSNLQINFATFQGGALETACGADNYVTYFTGKIKAPITGSVTFRSRSDDGFYLSIDGREIINDWETQGPSVLPAYNSDTTSTVNVPLSTMTISMVEGQIYDLRAWHFEKAGGSIAELYWQWAGQTAVIIPDSAFVVPQVTAAITSAPEGASAGTPSTSGGVYAFNGTTSVNVVSGVASFNDLGITGPAGDYVITYTWGNITRTQTITVTPGAPVAMVATAPTQTQAGKKLTSPTVKVVDSAGNTVTTASASITTSLQGSPADVALRGTTTRGAVNGVATFNDLSLNGKAGNYTLNFAVAGDALTAQTANVAVVAGDAARIDVVEFDAATSKKSGELFDLQPKVRLLDAYDNVVLTQPAVRVELEQVEVDGVPTGTLTNSDVDSAVRKTLIASSVDGLATFIGLSINGVDGQRYRLSITASGVSPVTRTFAITTGAPVALRLERAGSEEPRVGIALTEQPEVAIIDSGGNIVADVVNTNVTASIDAGATVSIVDNKNEKQASSGVATFDGLTINGTAAISGTNYTVTYSSPGLTAVTQEVTLFPGAVSQLSVNNIDTRESGDAFSDKPFETTPVVRVVDLSDNAVAVQPTTVTASITGCTGPTTLECIDARLVGSTSRELVDGEATFDDLGIRGKIGTYTVTYTTTIGGQIFTTFHTIVVEGGDPARMSVDQSLLTAQVGEVINPVITFLDSAGNPATTNETVTAAVAEIAIAEVPTGTLNGTTTKQASSGISDFDGNDLSIVGVAGQTYTVTYSATGVPSVEQQITLTPGAAATINIEVEPAGAASGTTLLVQPRVRLLDVGGNNAAGTPTVAVSVKTAPDGTVAGDALSGTESVNAVDGLATFSGLTLTGKVGEYELEFTSGDLTARVVTLDLAPGAASALSVVQAPTTVGTPSPSGSAFATQPRVAVTDAQGNIITSAVGMISATITGGADGSLVGTVSAFVENGVAVFNDLGISGLAANNPYQFTFTHSVTNLAVTQAVHVAAGPAAQLLLRAQTKADGVTTASRQVGVAFGDQNPGSVPQVVVSDSGGNRVTTSTASITATVSSGATLIGTTTVAAVEGIADFTDLGFVGTAGETYTITFTTDDLVSAAETLTAVTGPATKLGIAQVGERAKTGAPLITQPQIQLLDAGDNTVSTGGVAITVTSSLDNQPAGALSGTQTVNTNDSGRAVFTNISLLGTLGAEYTLTYASGNLQSVSHAVRVELGDPYALDLEQNPVGGAAGAPSTTQPIVVVKDFGGNIIGTATNAVTTSIERVSNPTDASLHQGSLIGSNPLTRSGFAEFDNFGIVGTAGETYRVIFASDGLQSVVFDLVASVGPAASVTIDTDTTDITAPAGDPIATAIAVSIRDAGGNIVATNDNVSAFVSSGATLTGTTTVAAVAGTAVFTDLRVVATAGQTPTVTFSVLGVGADSMLTTVVTGSASQLVPRATSRTSRSGDVFDTTIDVKDAGGNLVSSGEASTTIITATFEPVDVNGVETGSLVSDSVSTTSGVASGGSKTFALGVNGTVGVSYTVTYTATIGEEPNDVSLTGAEVVTVSEGAPVAISLTRESQGTASGVAFTTQPIVTAYDSGGNVVTGTDYRVRATISATPEGGALEGASVIPFVNGVAVFSGLGVTGVAGETYTVQYQAVASNSLDAVDGIVAVTQQISVSVGPAKGIEFEQEISGVVSGQTFGEQPIVRVVDSGGNIVTGSADDVTISIVGASDGSLAGTPTGFLRRDGADVVGNGSDAPSVTVSADDGVVRFAGVGIRGRDSVDYTVRFSATLNGKSTAIEQVIRPIGGVPASLVLEHRTNQASGFKQNVPSGAVLSTQPVIHIQDTEGNISVGSSALVVATISQVDGTGELLGTTAVNAVRGVATFTDLGVTGTANANYVITYSVDGVPVQTETITVQVGAPTQLSIHRAAGGSRAGVPLVTQPIIHILDSGNNLTTSTATVTVGIERLNVGGQLTGEVTGTTSMAAVGGAATFPNVAVGGVAGTSYTLNYSASVDGTPLRNVTQTVVPNAGEPVNAVIVRAATEAIIDEAFVTQPVIAVQDRFGNVVTESDAVVNVSVSAGGTLFGQTSRRAVNGRVQFGALGLRGTVGSLYTLSYGLTGYQPQTQTIRLFSGAANRLSIARPASGAASGASFAVAPQVVVKDAKGHTAIDANLTITARVRQIGGSGVLVGATTATAVNGVATFADLGLTGLAGTSYEVTYEAVGVLPDTQSITVTVGAPVTVELLRPSVGTAAAEAFTQQPQIVLRDSGDNVVPANDIEVLASVSDGVTLVGAANALTADGVATFENLGVSGPVQTNYTVTYTVDAVGATTQSGSVSLGTARTLALERPAVGGAVGAVFEVQPQVIVRDGSGNRVTTSSASITASITGTNAGLSGTLVRNAIQGLATFSNLGITGDAESTYTVTYSSPGLQSVTQSIDTTDALQGREPLFDSPIGTVDGFRVTITNFDADYTYSATATNGGRAMVTADGVVVVSGLEGDQTATASVTSSRGGYTSVTRTVQGRSLMRPGLDPRYENITPTVDGFTAQIVNYNPSYIWAVSLPVGARATIGVTGTLRVTGLPAGTEVTTTVTTTRPGYLNGSSQLGPVTTLFAGRAPTFGDVTRTDDGFVVPITNYDEDWDWSTSATGTALVAIDADGVMTVTELASGASSTVLVRTTRTNYNVGSASVTSRAISAARTPQLGSFTATATGWTIPITNYDSSFTWTATTSAGTVVISATSATAATLTVTGVSDAATANITVRTTQVGYQPGEASLSLRRVPGLAARFGTPRSTQSTITLPIANYDPEYTWTVSSSVGSATVTTESFMEDDVEVSVQQVVVTGLQPETIATVTVTTSRLGYTTLTSTYTYATWGEDDTVVPDEHPPTLPNVLLPIFGEVTRTVDGFTVSINNYASYDSDHTWTVRVEDGTIAFNEDTGLITVTGLQPGIETEVVVFVDKTSHRTALASISGSSRNGSALTPLLGATTSTADGFTFEISNFNPAYSFDVTVPGGTAVVSSSGVVTVSGLSPGAEATATVETSRSGYDPGTATITGRTTEGRALIPVYGLPEAAAGGFSVPITNYSASSGVTWSVSTSAGSIGGGEISDTGIVTVVGLSPGQSATITVTTSHARRRSGSATYTFAALSVDGVTPGVTVGLTPTFGSVTRTLSGFTVPITNYNSTYTWEAVSATGLSASINQTTGVLTVTGLTAGQTDVVVVRTNKELFGTGNSSISASSLAAGERERNALTGFTATALCPSGSPEGYGANNINDLRTASTYSCFVNSARNVGAYPSHSIGFYTSDLTSIIVDQITFTSSSSAPEHDPMSYSLWGCAEENQFCSAIVSNDITNLSTTRGADSVRTIRNTRAFRYYKLTFGTVRSATHAVNIGEISLNGRAAEQPALVPVLAPATVSDSGLQLQISNYSSLYSWTAQVPSPGIVTISTSGEVTVSNLLPQTTATLSITATRPGFATGTTSYSFTTSEGQALVPVLSRPVLTHNGARVRIENFNTTDYGWAATAISLDNNPALPTDVAISANGLIILTGYQPSERVQLTVSTSRTAYQRGEAVAIFEVPEAGFEATFGDVVRTDDGFTVSITNFDAAFNWSATATNGASVLIDIDEQVVMVNDEESIVYSAVLSVSNLAAGESSTISVLTQRDGYSRRIAQVTGTATSPGLLPVFSDVTLTDEGYEFTIGNYSDLYTWTLSGVENDRTLDETTGTVTVVSTDRLPFVTVSTARVGYQAVSSSIGPNTNALIPEFDGDSTITSDTTATVSIGNFDDDFAWSVAVVPSGRISIDSDGVITVVGASPGSDVTIIATTSRAGFTTGRSTFVVRTDQRQGITPAFAAPIRLVGGFTVDIANYDSSYEWSADSTAGVVVVTRDNVLVTELNPGETATVTLTASRSGYTDGIAEVTGTALLSPALVPQFGPATATFGGFTTQITNYDESLNWSATVSNGGSATISDTGLVVVSGLEGLATAEVVVSSSGATRLTGRGSTTGTSLVNPARHPRFGLTESTPDGFRVLITNHDSRWTWTPTVSGADAHSVSVSSDGWVRVSNVTGVQFITVTVKSERNGFISGSHSVSAYSLPEPRVSLGAQSVTEYRVENGQAILTTTNDHPFVVGDVIVVSGVSEELDGERVVTVASGASPRTFQFDTDEIDTALIQLMPSGSARLLDDLKMELLMNDAPEPIRALITVPFSAADSGTIFTATTLMSEVIDAGYRVVRVRAESETEGRVSQLNVPIRILFDPPADGAVPVYSGDDGDTWRILELLDGPFLPDDREDGYFVSADGRVWVFTRHLSIFGLLARQAVPITVAAGSQALTIGDVTGITVTGGEGDGELTVRNLTPNVCALSEDNEVTALRSGECVIEGHKAASDRFVEATGTLTLLVSDPPVAAPPAVDEPLTDGSQESVATKPVVKKSPTKKTTSQKTPSGTGDSGVDGDDVDGRDDDDAGQDDPDNSGSVDDDDLTKDSSGDGSGGSSGSAGIWWILMAVLVLLAGAGVAVRLRRRPVKS